MVAAQGKDQDFSTSTQTETAAETKAVASSSDEALASLKEQAKGKKVGDTVFAAFMENGQVKVYTASVNEFGISPVSVRDANTAEKAVLQGNTESRSNVSNETGATGIQRNEGERTEGEAKVDNFISSNVPKQFQIQVKNAFGTDAKVTTLEQDKIVYRYYGGDSAPSSYWFTPTKISNPILELALPPGNTAQYVDSIVLKKGTTVLEGTVAPNFGQPGGGYQYYVPGI
jgi:hypothetical protein